MKARESRTIEEFPAFIKYEDSDLRSLEVGILYWKLLMRLEHLLNLFFIERLLLKLGYAQGELLSVSFDMITYTLPFWTHQDTLLPLRGDCEWLVSDALSPSFLPIPFHFCPLRQLPTHFLDYGLRRCRGWHPLPRASEANAA